MRMDVFPKGLRFVNCGDVGLSQLWICENGQMWDERRQCYVSPQTNGQIELRSYDLDRDRLRFSYDQLYGYYFRCPWRQNICPLMRDLSFMNASMYVALSDGRVFSRWIWNYLVGNMSFDGYSRMLMKYDDGIARTVPTHRIIAAAFIPNPDGKNEVNHKDGNKLNNHISNLEWVWSYENMEHALHTGLRKSAISDDQIHEVCRLLELGHGNTEVSRMTQVPIHLIKGIKSGCHMRISKDYNIPRNKHFNLKPSNNTTGAHRTRVSTCADIP